MNRQNMERAQFSETGADEFHQSQAQPDTQAKVYDFETRKKIDDLDSELPHFDSAEREQLLAEIAEYDKIANSWGKQLRAEKILRQLKFAIDLKQAEVDKLKKTLGFLNKLWLQPKLEKAERELQKLLKEQRFNQDQSLGESDKLRKRQDELSKIIKQKLGIEKYSLKHTIYDQRKAELMAQESPDSTAQEQNQKAA